MEKESTGPKRKPIAERFWPKVEITDGCWLWRASLNEHGYGQLGAGGGHCRPLLAHRVSWEVHYGPIPAGMFICHTCDNPPCVRPDHLFMGNSADNHADMVAKGRSTAGDRNPSRLYPEKRARGVKHGAYTHPESRPWGERSWSAKLTADQVREIRQRATQGESYASLGRAFGVTLGNARMIALRMRWQHIE